LNENKNTIATENKGIQEIKGTVSQKIWRDEGKG
jgi:hypothetical protein